MTTLAATERMNPSSLDFVIRYIASKRTLYVVLIADEEVLICIDEVGIATGARAGRCGTRRLGLETYNIGVAPTITKSTHGLSYSKNKESLRVVKTETELVVISNYTNVCRYTTIHRRKVSSKSPESSGKAMWVSTERTLQSHRCRKPPSTINPTTRHRTAHLKENKHL